MSYSRDSIKDKIRDLEIDLRYLESEASSARDNVAKYWDKYKEHIASRHYNSTSEAEDALRESNYWGNVNFDIQRKIDTLRDKLRDLERSL